MFARGEGEPTAEAGGGWVLKLGCALGVFCHFVWFGGDSSATLVVARSLSCNSVGRYILLILS